MEKITMKSLFEAGVHLGHKTERWHPKMKPFIYGSKAGIYIIDIRQTLQKLQEAYEYVYNISANGGRVLFVGTKFQARDVMTEQAKNSDNYYVNLRWLGGMLTNFQTVKASIAKLKKFDTSAGPEGNYPGILKKEASKMEKDRKKLDAVLGGIADMKKVPSVIFVIDIKKEEIAIQEAKRLNIPVVAVVDSNCDPRNVDIVIPGNDDSVHSIELFAKTIAQASIDGKKAYEASNMAAESAKKAAKPAAKSGTKTPAKPAAKAETKPAAKPLVKMDAPKAAAKPAAPKEEAPKAETKDAAPAKAEKSE